MDEPDTRTKQLWGLVSVTLNYPQALDGAGLDQLKNQGFAFEIWRMNPDNGKRQVIAHSDYAYNKNSRYVEQSLKIFNAEWFFRLSPIRKWYEHPETWIFAVIGLAISFLLASLVIHNSDLRLIRSELETLTYNDQLTGIPNRRGLFKVLEELIADQDKKFVLCYLDLNKFKNVNDTFGHRAGDIVLRHFSGIIMRHVDKRHIFARIGGDEFILVFKNTGDPGEAARFFEKTAEAFKKPVSIGRAQEVMVGFCVGTAVFPTDGHTLDDLIAFADNAMYQEKFA